MSSTKYNISRSGASLMVREQSAGDGIFLFPFSASRIAIDESIGLFKVSYLGSRIEAYIGDILSHDNIQDLSDDIAVWSQQSAGLTQEEVEGIVSAAIQQSSDSNITLSSGKSIKLYNTTDKVTNYERFSVEWSGQTLNMTNQKGGSGQNRPIFVHVNTAGLYVSDASVKSGGIRVVTNPISGDGALFGVIGVLNGAGSTQQDGLVIAPYINQSASARANVIKVSPFIGTVGAGVNLLNLGTNTGVDNTGTHTPRFVVASNGNVGFGTDNPTHAVTLPQGAEWVSYNTADQTTNFERVRGYWSGNTYYIAGEQGGTGINRVMSLYGLINISPSSAVKATLTGTSSAANGGTFAVTGSLTSSSSNQNCVAITSTIAQSNTAGYRALFVSPYEAGTGTGTKLLLDLGTNSAANGAGTHTSKFSVDNNGNAISSGSVSAVVSYFTNSATSNLISQTNAGINIKTFGGSTIGKVFDNGNFFMGSSPVDAGYKLDVNGTARFSGDVTLDNNLGIGLNSNNKIYFGGNNVFIRATTNIAMAGGGQDPNGVRTFVVGTGQVGVGGTPSATSALLEMTSTTRAFLPPRMTTAQINAILSPAAGLVAYNTDLSTLCFYNGTAWQKTTSTNM